MITESNQISRITYEAFSKFSNCLNQCRKFEEIADCFSVNLKYLFNCYVFRASYCRNGTFVHVESALGRSSVVVKKQGEYLDYEKLLFNTSVPRRWTDLDELVLPDIFTITGEESPELWGWNFTNDKRQIIVSVLAGSRKRFSQKDINFVRLVSDNLETKLLELCLINELDEKNSFISNINKDQKEVIKARTKEIEDKNKTLLAISVLNAHNLREPLSRIMGLINLMNNEANEKLIMQVMPLLKLSANDLDTALQNVVNHATKDLIELTA